MSGDRAPVRRAAGRTRTRRSTTPAYRSTALRHPTASRSCASPAGLADPTELTGPVFGDGAVTAADADLTHRAGRRGGRPADHRHRPAARRRRATRSAASLIEIWQANASGRYRHHGDQWPGTLDPNFTGGGRVPHRRRRALPVHDDPPGAYPWGNHHNAWRPAHIHFSVFGRAFTQRLVTQMYFPDDPLFFQDPIFDAVPDRRPGHASSPATTTTSPSRRGRSATGSTSSCAARRRRRSRSRPMADAWPHAVADRRPVPAPRPRRPGAARRRRRPTSPTPSRSAARCSTATARRCPTPSSRRGRRTGCSPAAPPTPTARTRSTRASRRRCRRSTARRRRRTSSCRCSPAACSTASSPALYFDGDAGQRRRPGAGAPSAPSRRAARRRARRPTASLPLRHPPAGRR